MDYLLVIFQVLKKSCITLESSLSDKDEEWAINFSVQFSSNGKSWAPLLLQEQFAQIHLTLYV